jgi:hypothetical protein
MNSPNRPRRQSVDVLTIVVTFLSLFFSALAVFMVPQFQTIYVDLAIDLSLYVPTQLLIHTYRWLWLGAVLSGTVWFLNHQQILSEHRSLNLLNSIAICSIVYVVLGLYALYLPLFRLYDALG